MSPSDFVHLHLHSDYSLLDGACRIDKLVELAKAQGLKALALTDHGNMFGAIEFYRAVHDAALKPLIGYEAYVAPASRFAREPGAAQGEGAFHHVTLLARNEKGYHNLIKLATSAYLEGFYYKPRIDKELLAQHAHGLIAMSGCLGGEVAQYILQDRMDEARKAAGFYRDLFGAENYYFEVMDNGLSEQKKVNAALAALGAEMGVELVATNDVHYLTKEDFEAHEVLLCINTGKFLDDEKRLSFSEAEYYFKSPEEMAARLGSFPRAIENTRAIADKCNLELFFKDKHLPTFAAAAGVDNDTLFEQLCREGVRDRFGESPAKEVTDRLDREVGVIRRMGFTSLFLVAWDLVKTSREMGVPVGPGRGSAAGSLVSYCLKITNVDPIKYGLMFERLMDEKRGEAPDIDIDFCQEKREKVLNYVRDKYGRENVAQIITFGTMAARGVIRDVSRVLRYPLDRTDLLAKMVPAALNVTLASALQDSPDLASAYRDDPQVRRIIDIGKRLEGLARHASVHAAGVVLADKPLVEYVPLARVSDEITTQYSMESLEKVGLVKIDFLGLKTLTVLDRAVRTIRERHGVDIDLEKLDLEDRPTYEMLGRGEAMGVFQFESGGFRDLLKRMKPDRFADIIACVALYRPGPLGGGMVDDYVDRKHGKYPVTFQHPVLEEVLAPTYGVMVYQEQVMKIVNKLGGAPLTDCYTLVKAISKKRKEYIEAGRERFIKGAVKNGFDEKKAEKLFEQINYFGGYGFNQAHSTAYALIAFRTAYLKCHYPSEFMAALMTHEMNDTDKLKIYVDECRQTMGLKLLPPSVNDSAAGFTVTDQGIRFGLAAVKGVGERAVESMVSAREDGPFTSFYDLCSRVDLRVVNKSVLEALVSAGAFDPLGGRRAQYAAVLDRAMNAGQRIQADRQSGQSSFFDAPGGPGAKDEVRENLPNLPEWSETQMLAAEKSTLGFYLTSHPLARHSELIARFSNATAAKLGEFEDGTELTVGGMLTGVRYTVTRNGKSRGERMAMMNLEDLSGKCDAVVFPGDLVRVEGLVKDEAVVFVRGRLNLRREPPSIAVNEIIPLGEAKQKLTEAVVLRLDERQQDSKVMESLRAVFAKHRGRCSVFLELAGPAAGVTLVRADSSFSVAADASFEDDVTALLGEGHLAFRPVGPKRQPARNGGGRQWRKN